MKSQLITKHEIRNSKFETSTKSQKAATKPTYDLEDRTLQFAKDVRKFIKQLPKTVANIEDGKQLVRSSGSVGANYREANDSLSKKDFLMRVKISRKEAKETMYWLNLVDVDQSLELIRNKLLAEATELMKIFGSIIRRSE